MGVSSQRGWVGTTTSAPTWPTPTDTSGSCCQRKEHKTTHVELLRFIHCCNLFLFTRGLSCPSCIQASLSLNCLKLTIPWFPHNCLLVSCGDTGFLKNPRSSNGLEIRPQSAFFPLGCSCPLQTSQQRAVTPGPENLNSNKRAPNCHYYLQRDVTPDCMDSLALWRHIGAYFSRVEKPSDDKNSRLFLMNKKGFNEHPWNNPQCGSGEPGIYINTRLHNLYCMPTW